MKSMQITLALWSQIYREEAFHSEGGMWIFHAKSKHHQSSLGCTLVTWHQELGWGLGYKDETWINTVYGTHF